MADEYLKSRETELVLSPGVYAYVLDQTKGPVSVNCGPHKSSLSNTDLLVVYNARTKRFDHANGQQSAIQSNVTAPKNYYVILENPPKNGQQPVAGKSESMQSDALLIGQTENHPGPWSNPLWPGQFATVIKGHQLKSNQYLVVNIVDDEAAKSNWDKSVVKSSGSAGSTSTTALGLNKDDLVTGQMIIIKGTKVAFYIPPTGVEVLTDEAGNYVRDAVTLERLEYAVLLDESGNKEYVRGPAVVFPTPTQEFLTKEGSSKKFERKFKAYEMQPNHGIHIKVIADYNDDTGSHVAGDEMFITGTDMPIYYPREEHSIIKYGKHEKTYAVAIPSGEGRYVLNRSTGEIDLVVGPSMFLPNPINQVVVRRVLSPSECEMYYPGNRTVREINQRLHGKDLTAEISEDEYSDQGRVGAYAAAAAAPPASARRSVASTSAFADQFDRGTVYTPPRTITLDTKFDGAVNISVWSGYAVQVVNSKGDRRTVIGPQSVLLAYDEYLEKLSLSMHTPKTDNERINTPYLRYISNPVSDIIDLKTQDLVNVSVRVKYLVRFDPKDEDKWFSIDNYVQYMVDHLRSLIGNEVRNISVQEFYTDAATILRDLVLGTKTDGNPRALKYFKENGMTVYDLELIDVTIRDRNIADMLSTSRQETLSEKIELERASIHLELVAGIEDAKRKESTEINKTLLLTSGLTRDADESRAKTLMAKAIFDAELANKRKEADKAAAEFDAIVSEIVLKTQAEKQMLSQKFAELETDRQIRLEDALADAQKVRMDAVSGKLVEALTAMAQTGQLQSIAEHLAPLSIVKGQSLAGTFNQLLSGTPLEGMLRNIEGLSIPRLAA